jgi:predicted DNA-binding transcriptional regulator YafY
MNQATICSAIRSRNLIQFYYTGDATPGLRTVQPHMVAYNSAGHLALSAWFLGGASESLEGQGWREYLLSEMSNIAVLPKTFTGTRPGYRPDGGKRFKNVQCAL